MTEPADAVDMDAILDDALDELDDDDEIHREPSVESSLPSTTSSKEKKPAFGPPRAPINDESELVESFQQMFQDLTTAADGAGDGDDKLQKTMAALMGGMEGLMQEAPRKEPSVPSHQNSNLPKPAQQSPKANAANESTSSKQTSDEEKFLQDLFQGLVSSAEEMVDPADGEDIPNLDDLFGGNDQEDINMDGLMDGMMEQLLSKELMYEPMKQVTEKFPSWLETHKDRLSPDEWDQRNKQFRCFQRLVAAYEEDEDGKNLSTSKLLELMQEVQEYRQPPPEIINEIAPGLQLDEEGLPKFPGMMPPFPGMGNGAPGEEDCCIM